MFKIGKLQFWLIAIHVDSFSRFPKSTTNQKWVKIIKPLSPIPKSHGITRVLLWPHQQKQLPHQGKLRLIGSLFKFIKLKARQHICDNAFSVNVRLVPAPCLKINCRPICYCTAIITKAFKKTSTQLVANYSSDKQLSSYLSQWTATTRSQEDAIYYVLVQTSATCANVCWTSTIQHRALQPNRLKRHASKREDYSMCQWMITHIKAAPECIRNTYTTLSQSEQLRTYLYNEHKEKGAAIIQRPPQSYIDSPWQLATQ